MKKSDIIKNNTSWGKMYNIGSKGKRSKSRAKKQASLSTPYKTFSSFLKEKFGFPVYKIGIDAGFNCPHRSNDRNKGGCSYCNPRSFTPLPANPSLSVSEQVKNGIDSLTKHHKSKKFIAYFQTHTNTLASVEKLKNLYIEALKFDEIIGISIGTRPDCLSDQTIDLIHEISQKTFLMMELGLESANDKTLDKINRNHSVGDFAHTIKKIKEHSIHTCAHIILGLPGEDSDDMKNTAKYLSSVGVDGVKIHHFHVVKDTDFEKEYCEGKIKTFTIDEYKSTVIQFLECLSPEIIIHRLVGDCPEELLVAPKWDLRKIQVLKKITDEMRQENRWQGKKYVYP